MDSLQIDHMERAKRLEEIPLLEKEFVRREEERRKLWDELERERVERAIAERQLAMEQKRRLSRMAEDKECFIQKLQAERYEEYKKLKQAFDTKLANEKAKRLAARKVQSSASVMNTPWPLDPAAHKYSAQPESESEIISRRRP